MCREVDVMTLDPNVIRYYFSVSRQISKTGFLCTMSAQINVKININHTTPQPYQHIFISSPNTHCRLCRLGILDLKTMTFTQILATIFLCKRDHDKIFHPDPKNRSEFDMEWIVRMIFKHRQPVEPSIAVKAFNLLHLLGGEIKVKDVGILLNPGRRH